MNSEGQRFQHQTYITHCLRVSQNRRHKEKFSVPLRYVRVVLTLSLRRGKMSVSRSGCFTLGPKCLYLLSRSVGGYQSRSGGFRVEKNLVALSRIKRPATGLVTIVTELSQPAPCPGNLLYSLRRFHCHCSRRFARIAHCSCTYHG